MTDADFSLDELAAYLHLTPPQVARMVERGRVPGRKVGGQWRFSRAEIHHWMEERLGGTEEEVEQVEAVLRRTGGERGEEPISLADLVAAELVAVPLPARTAGKVITGMCDLAAAAGRLWDPEKMADAVREREQIHPTALDNGVALLHPRRPQTAILAEDFVALGTVPGGIPFGSSRLTDVFFLIGSTSDRMHLRILARLSRLVSDAAVLDGLRGAGGAEEARRQIVEFERGQA